MKKTIVITGGSKGLGKRLISLFSKNEDNIYSLSRSNKDNYKNHYACDVTNEQSVIQTIEKIGKACGKIDILICNAGIGLAGAIETTPTETVKKVFDVNFYGALHLIKAALKYMEKGSKIIVISSASAFFSVPYRSIYSASKSALNMMITGLNMELAKENINCCAICPGEIDTDFVKNRLWHTDDKNKDILESISNKFKNKQKSRMDAGKVSKKIFKIINKKRLKPVYIIGAKYRFFYFISKILPYNLLLKITSKKYGGKA